MPQSVFSEDDLLDISALARPVAYQTRFCPSGMGLRILSEHELSSIFEVTPAIREASVQAGTPLPYPMIPSSVILAALQPVLDSQGAPALSPHPVSEAQGHVSTKSWLPQLRRYLPHSWIDASVVSEKAAKADDAAVPSHMWDARIFLLFPQFRQVLPALRNAVIRWQRRRMLKEVRTFMTATHGVNWASLLRATRRKHRRGDPQKRTEDIALLCNGDAAAQALATWAQSSWWKWTQGSALLFWRWPSSTQQAFACTGMSPFINGNLPRYMKKAKKPKPEEREKLGEKLIKLIIRGYLVVANVLSFTDYFTVPKEDDVRPVFNGTSCGLNDVLWAPKFWLPTPETATRYLDINYYSVDIDLGEMFLNFPLHEDLQTVSGVDISWFDPKLRKRLPSEMASGPIHLRWTRTWMGCKPSPYVAVRYYYLAEEFARGKHDDPENALRWHEVKLNLPGSKEFDPTKPFVMKWDNLEERIAGDITAFVDDLRASGFSEEQAWAVARQVASRLQFLGIQDAARKRRPPVRSPGAWAGAMLSTNNHGVFKTVSQKKWDKAKSQINELAVAIREGRKWFDYKRLEQIRGFLCHLGMTFDIVMPYLKGFHLALSAHLPNRDREGWKVKPAKAKLVKEKLDLDEEDHEDEELLGWQFKTQQAKNSLQAKHENEETAHEGSPRRAPMLSQLIRDVETLGKLVAQTSPPKVQVRSKLIYQVVYGFADASGTGFGSTLQGNEGIRYRMGTWGKDDRLESSNFREFENVVSSLELEAKEGRLKNALIFLCTDNSTVEAALAKGNSSSRKLYDLVVRARLLEMTEGANIWVSHVSGERMKAQGTDGISRGVTTEGVATGISMLSYLPFDKSAMDRSTKLLPWIRSWLGDQGVLLKPEDWFTLGHDIHDWKLWMGKFWVPETKSGTYIWAPPPAAADVAVEELRKARIKRQDSLHIVIVPKLLQTKWRKSLYKAADLIFDMPAGDSPWPTHMFEGLTCAILFPYLSHSPWQLKGTPKMFQMERQLRRMFQESFHIHRNQHDDEEEESEIEAAWGRKSQPRDDFMKARNGDHLIIPFECDLCIFRKLRNCSPLMNRPPDQLLMAAIRRINLDAFWSRATSTVRANKDKVAMSVSLSATVGLEGPYDSMIALPNWDYCGYEVAIQMVLYSRKPGRYQSTYTQFDTIRKLRSVYSNFVRSSTSSNQGNLSLGDTQGRYQRLTADPCGSFWFQRFVEGCRNRMGQDWRPNRAFSTELLLTVIDRIHNKVQGAEAQEEKNLWITVHAFVVVGYILSLRGPEVFLLDLRGLINLNQEAPDLDHFNITLLGRIKGERHHRQHIFPCAKETKSGILCYEIVMRLVEWKKQLGLFAGPAISNLRGELCQTNAIDEALHEVLEEIMEDDPTMFPPDIRTREKARSAYQVFRSLRKTSDTRAIQMGVDEPDIDVLNRWRQREKAKGKKPGYKMNQYYAQGELLLDPFLRYTQAM